MLGLLQPLRSRATLTTMIIALMLFGPSILGIVLVGGRRIEYR